MTRDLRRLTTGLRCPFCGSPVFRLVEPVELADMKLRYLTIGYECDELHPMTQDDLDMDNRR